MPCLDGPITPQIHSMMSQSSPYLNIYLYCQIRQQSTYTPDLSDPERSVLIPQVQRALTIPNGTLRLQCKSQTLMMKIQTMMLKWMSCMRKAFRRTVPSWILGAAHIIWNIAPVASGGKTRP